MNNELKKFLAPAAAVTSLFMIGCGEDEDSNILSTNTDLLVGNWNLEKVDGSVYEDDDCYENQDGEKYCYSYKMTISFAGDGDFSRIEYEQLWDGNTETKEGAEVYDYAYEGSWEFISASEDTLMLISKNDWIYVEGKREKTVNEDEISYDTLITGVKSVTSTEMIWTYDGEDYEWKKVN